MKNLEKIRFDNCMCCLFNSEMWVKTIFVFVKITLSKRFPNGKFGVKKDRPISNVSGNIY